MCDLHHRDEAQSELRVGISEFVDELVVAFTNSRVYAPDHPRVRDTVSVLVRSLESLFDENDPHRLKIGAADGFLFVNERPLLGASLSALRILQPLKQLQSGGIVFHLGADESDFMPFVELLGRRKLDASTHEEFNVQLSKKGCRSIQLLPAYTATDTGEGSVVDTMSDLLGTTRSDQERDQMRSLEIPIELYQNVVDLLQESMVRVCRGEHMDISQANGFIEAILKRLYQDAKSLMSISRYEQYDAFTFGHSIRVCFIALNFARSMTDDVALLHRIGLAALLHDVGKAWVPFEVLHSTGALSDEERAEMDKHATHGGEILLDIADTDPMSVASAFGHHRTLDNRGYPETVHYVRLSAGTKIVKICDVYEALTAVRPYKPPMSPTRAYRIMMSMNKHFDRRLLKQFIKVNGIYPVGSRVRLSTGETARVIRQATDLQYPVVEVDEDPDGAMVKLEERRETELGAGVGTVQELLLENELG